MDMKLTFAIASLLTCSATIAAAQEDRTIRLGVEIPASIVNVPMFITIDRIKELGYETQIVEFQSPETMTLALQNGEVDLIGTSAGTAFSAIDAGLDGKAFLGMTMSDFVMVARTELTTCQSLDGKNVAVQSREGTTGVLTARWLASECPEAKPNVLIVPGSENRVAGLIAGQLDASPVDSQNAAQLMALRPGEFDTIDSFAEAGVLASVYLASTDWLTNQAETAKVLAKEYTAVVEETKTDSSEFIQRTQALLSDTDPAIVEQVAKSWVERGVLVPVSGVQPEAIEDAIAFYSSAQPYSSIKEPADVATTDFVSGLTGQ